MGTQVTGRESFVLRMKGTYNTKILEVTFIFQLMNEKDLISTPSLANLDGLEASMPF